MYVSYSATNNITQCYNIGVERRRTVTGLYDSFCHIFFFLNSFSLHLFVSQRSLNDEERGGNCLLVPERSYGAWRKHSVQYEQLLLLT